MVIMVTIISSLSHSRLLKRISKRSRRTTENQCVLLHISHQLYTHLPWHSSASLDIGTETPQINTRFSRANPCLVSPMQRDKSLFLNLAVKKALQWTCRSESVLWYTKIAFIEHGVVQTLQFTSSRYSACILTIKNAIFWDVAPCRRTDFPENLVVSIFRVGRDRERRTALAVGYQSGEGYRLLPNVGSHKIYTLQLPRR
jgi:hypothetical protein